MKSKVSIILIAIVFFLPSSSYAIDSEELVKKYSSYAEEAKKYYSDKNQFYKGVDDTLEKWRKIVRRVKLKEPFKMKIATLAPEGTAWIAFASEFVVPFLYDISEGRINVLIYTGGIMGEDRDILRKMRLGQIHGCGCTAQGLLTVAPELSVFSLPFLFKDYKEIDHILKTFRKDIESILAQKGLMLFALLDTGYFYTFLKGEVTTLEELKKKKFITWFGDIERAFLAELDIQPIPIAVPEVVASLRSGIINADMSPAAWFLGSQAYLTTDYFIEQPFFYSISAIVLDRNSLINEGKRYGLNDKDSEEMVRLSIESTRVFKLEEAWNEQLRDYEKKCLKGFVKHGIKPIKLDDKELIPIEEAGKRTGEKQADKLYPRVLYNKITKEIKKFRGN